jgi:hypothetical protein
MTCVRGGNVLRGMDAAVVTEQVAEQLVAWKGDWLGRVGHCVY